MGEYVAYGFANTNRSDSIIEHTLAYKQLGIFNADRIVIDVHWHSEKREELEKLIATLGYGDVIYMYSIDTLLKGKNRGVEYYKQIIEKNIQLIILNHNGDLPKWSIVSTSSASNIKFREFSVNEKAEFYSNMEKIASEYVPAPQTGKTTDRANISQEFKEIYFMYEAYRITEKTMMEMLPIKLNMTNKQTFMSLCREYEKSVYYVRDFETYCDADPMFLHLPKRTGKFPREYDEIIALANGISEGTEKERINQALKELRIMSSPDIIHRWKLAKDKVPKPRKPDGREVEPVKFDEDENE